MGGQLGNSTRAGGGGERGSPVERGGDRTSGQPRDVSSERLVLLTRTIEAEIIPRLLLASTESQCSSVIAAMPRAPAPDHANVEELAALVLKHDLQTSQAYIHALLMRGTSLDDVFLRLLAPTARHLGELWEADLRDFTEVTIGLSILQQILHTLSPNFAGSDEAVAPGHRVLLIPARGETHTFGLHMLEQFFRRSGWDVDIGRSGEFADFTKLVANEYIDIVGFSLSCEAGLDDLTSDIKAVRRKSRNRSVGIMVGGPAFLRHPERVKSVGADATAADGQLAMVAASRILSKSAKRSD